MAKELFLVSRLLYSILFVGLAILATGLTSPMQWVAMFVLTFVFSFMWQYLVLHSTLKRMEDPRLRIITLIVWMLVATLVGGWSLGELTNFDYLQGNDTDMMVRSFVQQLTIYGVACEMFIAGACARLAFQKYGWL